MYTAVTSAGTLGGSVISMESTPWPGELAETVVCEAPVCVLLWPLGNSVCEVLSVIGEEFVETGRFTGETPLRAMTAITERARMVPIMPDAAVVLFELTA